MQPGLRVTPGKWSTPQTAGGSSVDRLEQHWSESPDHMNMVSAVYMSLETFHLHTFLFVPDNDRYYWDFVFGTGQMIVFSNCCHTTGRNLFCSTSTSLNVPVLWCCWSSNVPPHRSETISTDLSFSLKNFLPFTTTKLFIMIVYCFLCPVVCGKLSWQTYDFGESQIRQQRRPWILPTIL